MGVLLVLFIYIEDSTRVVSIDIPSIWGQCNFTSIPLTSMDLATLLLQTDAQKLGEPIFSLMYLASEQGNISFRPIVVFS